MSYTVEGRISNFSGSANYVERWRKVRKSFNPNIRSQNLGYETVIVGKESRLLRYLHATFLLILYKFPSVTKDTEHNISLSCFSFVSVQCICDILYCRYEYFFCHHNVVQEATAGLRYYSDKGYRNTGVLISPQPDQEGNKLQRQKILMFIYHIYNHNWRNISTIYILVYNKTSIKRNILTIKHNTSGSRSG